METEQTSRNMFSVITMLLCEYKSKVKNPGPKDLALICPNGKGTGYKARLSRQLTAGRSRTPEARGNRSEDG